MAKRTKETYYCFRCGKETNKGLTYTFSLCPACGEKGVLSLQTCLDILNDLYLNGELSQYDIKEFDLSDWE